MATPSKPRSPKPSTRSQAAAPGDGAAPAEVLAETKPARKPAKTKAAATPAAEAATPKPRARRKPATVPEAPATTSAAPPVAPAAAARTKAAKPAEPVAAKPRSRRRSVAVPVTTPPAPTVEPVAAVAPPAPRPRRKPAARPATPRTSGAAPARRIPALPEGNIGKALSVGSIVAVFGAAVFSIYRLVARRPSEGTAPTDLMGSEHPDGSERAIQAFRPDPTAPVPPEEREALRPALLSNDPE